MISKDVILNCLIYSNFNQKNIAFFLFHAFSESPHDANPTKVMKVSASCSPRKIPSQSFS